MSTSSTRHTRIPRRAAQMDAQELSPLTVKRGVVLDKPRRRDTQISETALARASAILRSPQASPMVTPRSCGGSSSSSSTRQKIHDHLMLEHFANLDIDMVYTLDDDDNQAEAEPNTRRSHQSYDRERSDSMDMAEMFFSEH